MSQSLEKSSNRAIKENIITLVSQGVNQANIAIKIGRTTRFVQYQLESLKDETESKTLPQLLFKYGRNPSIAENNAFSM